MYEVFGAVSAKPQNSELIINWKAGTGLIWQRGGCQWTWLAMYRISYQLLHQHHCC